MSSIEIVDCLVQICETGPERVSAHLLQILAIRFVDYGEIWEVISED